MAPNKITHLSKSLILLKVTSAYLKAYFSKSCGVIYFETFCLFFFFHFFQCERKLSKYSVGHLVHTFSWGKYIFNSIISMNLQILSFDIYLLQDQLKTMLLTNGTHLC